MTTFFDRALAECDQQRAARAANVPAARMATALADRVALNRAFNQPVGRHRAGAR